MFVNKKKTCNYMEDHQVFFANKRASDQSIRQKMKVILEVLVVPIDLKNSVFRINYSELKFLVNRAWIGHVKIA